MADEPDLKFLAEQVARMIAEARGSTAAAAVNAQDLFRLRAEVEALKISNAEIRTEVEAVRTEMEPIRPEIAAVKIKVEDLADGQRGLLTALQGVREALDAVLKKLP